MARARNIKPGFFTNEDLVELDFATRLLFAGLWTVADKAGRLEDRPKKIKIDVFPADDVDIDGMLTALAQRGFITRYTAGGKAYIQVNAWDKHQRPHHTEKESSIPPNPQDGNGGLTVKEPLEPVESQKQDGGNPPDSLIPDTGFTDSSVANATGGTPPTNRDLVFAKGVPLLTTSGVSEKNARSMLAALSKKHGEAAVLQAVEQTAHDRPGEPVSWLQSLLVPRPRTGETVYQASQRERVAEFAPRLAKRDPSTPTTIDEVFHVPALASR